MDDRTKPQSEIIPPGQAIELSRKLDTMLTRAIRETRGGLAGKVTALTLSMKDFEGETHGVLDGVADKIAVAKRKRDQAADAYHQHYDGLIDGFQETIDAVERLSNLPLDGESNS